MEETLFDVRQKTCWDLYVDPKSETFGNAYRSAMKAGYSESYSATITTMSFFLEKVRRMNLLSKAEKALDKTLNYGTDYKIDGVEKVDKELLRIQTDVAKHITKTLGKDEGYAERSEVTGKNGSAIVFMPAELIEKFNLGEPKVEETPVIEEVK
jgi:hypothetical protein